MPMKRTENTLEQVNILRTAVIKDIVVLLMPKSFAKPLVGVIHQFAKVII